MMKKIGMALTILLLILPSILAVEINMKDELNRGETLMAKVSGNFLKPVLKENIFFYRKHIKIPIEYDIAKMENELYIYAQLKNKEAGNYSLRLENVIYKKATETLEEDIIKNFTITEKLADFSINPGFIMANDNFFIEVENLQDSKITITKKTAISEAPNKETGFFESLFGEKIEPSPSSSVNLNSGETKKINFELKDISQSTLNMYELSTPNLRYEIPVYIMTKDIVSKTKEKRFRFEPKEINLSMTTSSNQTRIIYLKNTGEEEIQNITLEISDSLRPYISLSSEKIESLNENSSEKIEITFTSNEEEIFLEGQISARFNDTLYTYSAIFFNVIKGFIPLNESEVNEEKEEVSITSINCKEAGGEFCNDDEKCSEDAKNARDGVCCFATCNKIEKSRIGKTIGWALIAIILFFLIWFFRFKYRRAKREINLFKIAKRKR